MKKIFAALLIMLCGIFAVQTPCAQAADDSTATATEITLGSGYAGEVSKTNTSNSYKFTLPASGTVTLKSTGTISRLCFYFYDDEGEYIYDTEAEYTSDEYEGEFELTSGTYYLKAEIYNTSWSWYSGEYTLSLSFESAEESFAESNGGSNNTISEAGSISLATTYTGQIAINDDEDYYQFVLPTSGEITLTSTSVMDYLNFYVYDEKGKKLFGEMYERSGITGELSVTESMHLTSGTYYLKAEMVKHYGVYSFQIDFTSAEETFLETNGGSDNETSTANTIMLHTAYRGQIAENDSVDYYKFELTKESTILLSIEPELDDGGYLEYEVLYAGGAMAASGYAYATLSADDDDSSESTDITLSEGIYYLVISPESSEKLGNYSFQVSLEAPVISAVENRTSGVKVTWGAVTGAENYRVYRMTESGDWEEVKNTTATSYTDKDVAGGESYYYKVCCVDDTNTYEYSDCSASKGILYLKAGVISKLKNVKSGVKIKWSRVTGAAGYRIYRKSASGKYTLVKTVTKGSATSYTDKKVKSKNGTTYTYYVQPYSGSTKGSYKTAKITR